MCEILHLYGTNKIIVMKLKSILLLHHPMHVSHDFNLFSFDTSLKIFLKSRVDTKPVLAINHLYRPAFVQLRMNSDFWISIPGPVYVNISLYAVFH